MGGLGDTEAEHADTIAAFLAEPHKSSYDTFWWEANYGAYTVLSTGKITTLAFIRSKLPKKACVSKNTYVVISATMEI